MIKAFFVDFYGTLVHEDGRIVKKISDIISDSGCGADSSEIDSYWGKDFKNMFRESYGSSFVTQRKIEKRSIKHTLEKFHSDEDASSLSEMLFEEWGKPEIYEDSKSFLEQSPIPVYILSNIDNEDIRSALDYHSIKTAGVFTSEDAKAYKPRREIFEYALEQTGLMPNEVIHIGDSIGADVTGASSLNIRALWLNRNGRETPNRVKSISSLNEALNYIK